MVNMDEYTPTADPAPVAADTSFSSDLDNYISNVPVLQALFWGPTDSTIQASTATPTPSISQSAATIASSAAAIPGAVTAGISNAASSLSNIFPSIGEVGAGAVVLIIVLFLILLILGKVDAL
jgi:hypothetical protein